MLLKIECEYCGNEKLEETNCDTTFYCPDCDDEISIHECEVDIVKEEGLIDKDSLCYNCIHLNLMDGTCNNNCGCAGETIEVENISNFADYLIENASYAFEHQDRELLERVLRDYNRIK